jgi:hypothetical protein
MKPSKSLDRSDMIVEPYSLEDAVQIPLPWTTFGGKGRLVSQPVLKEYADSVREAIDLYLQHRADMGTSFSAHHDLTDRLWKLLHAAHPHPLWQWGEWEDAWQQFHRAIAPEEVAKAA